VKGKRESTEMNRGNLDSKNQHELYNEWEERQKKANQYSHNSVLEKMVKKAEVGGWKTLEHHEGREAGIDLKLERNNRVVVIEAVEERPTQPNITGRVKMALGAIILDMKNEETEKEYRYCLAFPATPAFTNYRIPGKPRKQLQVSIIFVECFSGLLKVLLPDGQDTEDAVDLSNFDQLFQAV
jgi:hypothetical protein